MRTLLNLRSQIATPFANGEAPGSLSAQGGPQSSKPVLQRDTDRLIPLTREVCPSAPIDIEPSADSRSSRRVRRAGSLGDDGTTERKRDEADVGSDLLNADHAGGSETKRGGRQNKPAIIVIHRRAVFRDCFVRCLEIAYGDHSVYSFACVADWFASAESGAASSAVIIIVVESGDGSLADLEVLENVTEKVPVIIVSDVDDVDHILRTLKRGARGYIPSSLPFNIAVEAVRLVEAGGVFLPASSFVEREQAFAPAKTAVPFTGRQMEVLGEVRHGKANKQIAYELNMSEHTVKVHLRHIMRKLKARNRTEVAVLSENLFPDIKG